MLALLVPASGREAIKILDRNTEQRVKRNKLSLRRMIIKYEIHC